MRTVNERATSFQLQWNRQRFPNKIFSLKKKRKMELLANFDEKREYRNLLKQVFIYACIFFDWYYKSLLQKTSENYFTFVQMLGYIVFLDP